MMTRDDLHELLRDYNGADMLRRSYHQAGKEEKSLQEEATMRAIEQRIWDAFDALSVPGLAADGRCGVTVYDLLSDAMVNDLVNQIRDRVQATYPYPGSVDLRETAVESARSAAFAVLTDWRRDPNPVKQDDPGDHGDPDIAWAMRRLRALATVGERFDQVQACEAIVRSVKVIAETGSS